MSLSVSHIHTLTRQPPTHAEHTHALGLAAANPALPAWFMCQETVEHTSEHSAVPGHTCCFRVRIRGLRQKASLGHL